MEVNKLVEIFENKPYNIDKMFAEYQLPNSNNNGNNQINR